MYVIIVIINISQLIKMFYLLFTLVEQDIWNVPNAKKRLGIKNHYKDSKNKILENIIKNYYIFTKILLSYIDNF